MIHRFVKSIGLLMTNDAPNLKLVGHIFLKVVHVFPRDFISKSSLIMHLVIGNNRFYMSDTIKGTGYYV